MATPDGQADRDKTEAEVNAAHIDDLNERLCRIEREWRETAERKQIEAKHREQERLSRSQHLAGRAADIHLGQEFQVTFGRHRTAPLVATACYHGARFGLRRCVVEIYHAEHDEELQRSDIVHQSRMFFGPFNKWFKRRLARRIKRDKARAAVLLSASQDPLPMIVFGT